VCPNAIINSDHSGGNSFSFQILVAVLEAVATIPISATCTASITAGMVPFAGSCYIPISFCVATWQNFDITF
jgi:hypothetical protein